ncbi:sporulation protein [Baekduia alba]|uniref:CAP domain-containing protein n=1 Tax=Baekduia alba TaxID=2997333 RepID=UPI0023408FE8|nr:CAP domain-containing protein [Baekduia alba]WCB95511.1 sporulation protein [Baekduia alba]
MRRLRFLLPAIATACVLAIAPAAANASASATTAGARACPGANLAPSLAHAAQARRATLCLLNRQRVRHGLRHLRLHRSLSNAATRYARLMVTKHFFNHVSPAGSTLAQRVKRTNYLRHTRGWALGENLAWGSGTLATPTRIVNAWMHSPGHRRNILDGSFREIGIGIALGAPSGGSGATYVNEFGARA